MLKHRSTAVPKGIPGPNDLRSVLTAVTALGLFALLALPTLASAQRQRTDSSDRGWIGVRPYFEVTVINGKRSERLAIVDVVEESPADRAGIKPGDRIVRINGKTANATSLDQLSRGLTSGDTVRLRIASADRERDVTLIAEQHPSPSVIALRRLSGPEFFAGRDSVLTMARVFMDSAMRVLRDTTFIFPLDKDGFVFPHDSTFAIRIFGETGERILGETGDRIFSQPGGPVFRFRRGEDFEFPNIEGMGARSISGAEFTELNDGLAEYFGTREGLLVLRVARGTPADRAGLEAGDVVTRADTRTVRSVAGLRSIVMQARGESVRLEILRKGQKRTLEL